MSKPVRIYQDCATCNLGSSAIVSVDKTWWRTSKVVSKRDTPQGLPRFETLNTIYQPDAHDGGDPLNKDYEAHREKVNLDNPFKSRFIDDEFIAFYESGEAC